MMPHEKCHEGGCSLSTSALPIAIGKEEPPGVTSHIATDRTRLQHIKHIATIAKVQKAEEHSPWHTVPVSRKALVTCCACFAT